MRLRQPRAAPEQLLAQRAGPVRGLVQAAALELREDELDDLGERARRDHVGDVEAVDAGLLDPGLELVGHRLTGADDHGRLDADTAPLRELAEGPVALSELLHGRLE